VLFVNRLSYGKCRALHLHDELGAKWDEVKENEKDGWDQEDKRQENYNVNLSRKAEQKSTKRQVYLLLAHFNLTSMPRAHFTKINADSVPKIGSLIFGLRRI
jgi:hypothetical protein